jgi:D-sedoheptulose 7-phosphate isomerase
VCKYKKIRKAIPAISLATDTSILTSIGNDMDFKFIFSRQIEAIGKKGDIAIAITTSGNSNNLIEATKVANKKGILTFCFAGNSGGRLKKYVNYPILIPSKTTSQIIFRKQLFIKLLNIYLNTYC